MAKMAVQFLFNSIRQYSDAIFESLPITNDDLVTARYPNLFSSATSLNSAASFSRIRSSESSGDISTDAVIHQINQKSYGNNAPCQMQPSLDRVDLRKLILLVFSSLQAMGTHQKITLDVCN
jgi:hypothetical protein